MRAFLVAGEASGDRLGAALMEGFDALLGPGGWQPLGVGGEAMTARGLKSLFPMDELAVMGLADILRSYPALRRRLHETAEAAIAARPDVLITIDIPEFSLRLARLVRARVNVPTVHYVAPSVWAWRAGRARRMARHVDHVLALLPFEPPYMTAAGMSCDFVGHPIAAEPRPDTADERAFRAAHDLGEADVLLVLPGSRRGETARHLPLYRETVARFLQGHPTTRPVIPTTGARFAEIADAARDWPGNPIVLPPAGDDRQAALRRGAFRAASVALAASGTVVLELAQARTPMVIAHDAGLLTRALARALVRIDTANLVNLVSGDRVVPEFFFSDARPDRLAEALAAERANPDPQLAAMERVMRSLGEGGEAPGLRAARSVQEFLMRKKALSRG